MAFRAFVAIPVPAEERLTGLSEAVAACGADLKTTDPRQMHLTLSFLGQVPDDATPSLARALDQAVAGTPPFRLQLHGVGAFPTARRPRVVWAGARPQPLLDALAERVRARLREAGFPGDDKPFRVHLTLARVRSPQGMRGLVKLLEEHHDAPLHEIAVEDVRLYRSTLGRGGAVYDVLHQAKLEA